MWGMPVAALSDTDREEERDLYERANLYPRDTGLPMTVWVSPKCRARHDARVKVCMTPGECMTADQAAVMIVRPEPRLLHGELSSGDLAQVQAWITGNAEVLIDYWDGRAGTGELIRRLQQV